MFRIYLEPGASGAAERQSAFSTAAGSTRRLFVLTNQERPATTSCKLTDQWFGMTYIQIAVAVLVAVLGIVNTLTVSITDRRRELGVLQAVGGLRKQIRRTVWIEALAIGVTRARCSGWRWARSSSTISLEIVAPRLRRTCAWIMSTRSPMRSLAVSRHSGGRVHRRPLARRIRRTRLSGGGSRI